MVALSSRRPLPGQRRRLLISLDKAASDLAELERVIGAVSDAPTRKSEICPRALTALARLVRAGRVRIAARIQEVGAQQQPVPSGLQTPVLGLEGFMIAYRRCGRRLCLALAEAREVSDTVTADLLFHLLRDFERQLWLVDGRRGRLPLAPGGAVLFQPS